LLFSRLVTLNPIAILVGIQLSAAATISPATSPAPTQTASVKADRAVAIKAEPVLEPLISLEKLAGSEITLFNVNTRETETFFLRYDGKMTGEDLKRITHLFRCKRTGHKLTPNKGLLQILSRVATHYPGKVFEIVSAHRHNRGTSRTSKHWTGHAVDLRVRDVNVKELRSYLWKMEDPIGLGYYREQQFVHIDYRPDDGKIAWDQRREGSTYHYHPAWSGGPPKHVKAARAAKAAKAAKRARPSRARTARSARPNT
jgi:uncharacterized protein YcbK (DUF882 family)